MNAYLKRIEDGLVTCIGALYLISPVSVKRNWINFELGAIWIRNVMSLRSGGPEIPTLPLCHSGITPSQLPAPLNNLNAITANQPPQLQFAFRSLQAAVGGRGTFRTNFDQMAAEVADFESRYTLGQNLKRVLTMLKGDIQTLITCCEQQPPGMTISVDCGFVETSTIHALQAIEANELKGHIAVNITNPGTRFTTTGAVNGEKVELKICVDLFLKYKSQLLT